MFEYAQPDEKGRMEYRIRATIQDMKNWKKLAEEKGTDVSDLIKQAMDRMTGN